MAFLSRSVGLFDWKPLLIVLGLVLSSCGGGGGGSNTGNVNDNDAPVVDDQGANEDPPSAEEPSETPEEPSLAAEDRAFESEKSTARFLTQATFGANSADIDALTGTSASEWLQAQFDADASLNLPLIDDYLSLISSGEVSFYKLSTPTFSFWKHAIEADDQLRQRMAFALSQIVVVSNYNNTLLLEMPEMLGYYQDVLVRNALGNYRDLLEEVTYSPAMAYYLTYLGNEKGDPETGRVPDENYARELLQLFSIGVIALNTDGSPQTDSDGEAAIELYDNQDVTGLARVFTGLFLDLDSLIPVQDISTEAEIVAASRRPMRIFPNRHSDLEKQFLGLTIPENTDAETSIDMALDHIMAQPSVAPFIARQLIQRFVTSHPAPDYIARVAAAFETGNYQLPNGDTVGESRKGDLKATIAAVLFDDDARDTDNQDATFGKVREPILRITNWARAFDIGNVRPELFTGLWQTANPDSLNQHPYRSRSVFNFYRPGYVAPGTETAAQNLTMPEIQLINATSVPSYANFVTTIAARTVDQNYLNSLSELFFNSEEGGQINLDVQDAANSFVPNYEALYSLAEDAALLVEELDLLLSYGNLTDQTKASVIEAIELVPLDAFNEEARGPEIRVQLAIIMIMTSPDFIVQR